jgi:hypothetical protein|tara:strand:- start:93 stop:374 length:282 start_codon:yes stop_codon:yes gene_type:complete
MTIRATVQSSGNTRAKITSTTSNRPERVAVTVPATATAINNADFSLKSLGDVDVSNLADGGILQFRSSDGKFVLRNELEETVTGALTLNAGNF